MDRDFVSYLLVTVLAVIIGGWLVQSQIGEPLVQMVERTATTIATSGRR